MDGEGVNADDDEDDDDDDEFGAPAYYAAEWRRVARCYSYAVPPVRVVCRVSLEPPRAAPALRRQT